MAEPSRDRRLIDAAWAEASDLPPPPPPDRLPEGLAGYALEREIHRGAQGVVYLARRETSGRPVAVKVMVEGPFAGPRHRARFEREVRILGQLRHPNIVRVHESGAANGRTWFVMDHIDGRPLDVHVAESAPTVGDTVRLFATVCEAVNVAHLRGIIHRDLKPGNVLVDAAGEPHVLDFGVAKAPPEEEPAGGPAALTSPGQFVGSLPWASPEQARGEGDDLDVRTDVYSLGVMLFQLLTGTFPYPVTGSMRHVQDVIASREPARPRGLRRGINGELETIVLKCLSKDRERRYQSAGELARDLRRSLAGEPIEARRDSGWYVLGKTLRRHRLATAVGAAFVMLVTASSVAWWAMYREAEQQRLKSGRTLEGWAESYMSLLEGQDGSLDPFAAGIPRRELVENIQAFSQRFEADLADQPDVAAALHTKVGLGCLKLGLYPDAKYHLERALRLRRGVSGLGEDALAESEYNLGRALFFNCLFEEARVHYERALGTWRTRFGDDSLQVAEGVQHVGACLRRLGRLDEAEDTMRRALDIRRRRGPPDDPRLAGNLNNLATCLRDRGEFAAAEALFNEALDLVRTDDLNPLYLARGLRNVATCRLALGDRAGATALLEEAGARIQKVWGDRHPSLGALLVALARCAFDGGDFAAARDLAGRGLAIQQAMLPAPHTDHADTLALLARIAVAEGRLDAAAGLLEGVRRTREALLPPGHPDQGDTRLIEAMAHEARGDHDAAARAARAALDVLSPVLVPEHPWVVEAKERAGG